MKRMPKVSIGTLVIIGAIGILLLWGVISKKSVTHYVNNEVTIATTTEPAYPADWLEEAEKAKASVLRKKELEKENAELEIKIKELETRQAEIEKELGSYWREEFNVVNYIKKVFPENPELFVAIARGESGLKQWHDNGKVVRGIIDPDDTGLFQINKRYWGEDAKKLGLDFEGSIEDNIKMARYIYDTQGLSAWVYYTKYLAYSS